MLTKQVPTLYFDNDLIMHEMFLKILYFRQYQVIIKIYLYMIYRPDRVTFVILGHLSEPTIVYGYRRYIFSEFDRRQKDVLIYL